MWLAGVDQPYAAAALEESRPLPTRRGIRLHLMSLAHDFVLVKSVAVPESVHAAIIRHVKPVIKACRKLALRIVVEEYGLERIGAVDAVNEFLRFLSGQLSPFGCRRERIAESP